MSATFHMSLSVRGALRWDKRTFRRYAKGFGKTPGELTDYLLDALSRGHEAVPLGDCSDFDPKTGCRGHRAAGDAA